jgi:hypothetical protein
MSFPCAANFAAAAVGDSSVSMLAARTLAFLESVHEETPAALTSKGAELAELACHFLRAGEDVGSLEEQVARLRVDLRETQRKLAALTTESQRKLAALAAEFTAYRTAHSADIAELRASLASLTRPRDLLWMREAAATIFHSIAEDVTVWDDAARVDTLAQLRDAIKGRGDSSERGAALERRLAELGLTPAREEAVARMKRLGNAAAHCDLSEGGELCNADICAAFEAKAAAVLPATAVSPRASSAPTRVTADDGREVARLLRLVLL